MASSAEIAPTTPDTLPADFSGWDSEEAPAALPAGANDFKAVPGPADAPEPSAKYAHPRVVVTPAADWSSSEPSLTPAAAFAEAEAFLQTFRPRPIDPEELDPRMDHGIIGANKMVLAGFAAAAIVLLAILIAWVYPKMARAGRAKQPVVQHSIPSAQAVPAPPQPQSILRQTGTSHSPQPAVNVALTAPSPPRSAPLPSPPQVQTEMMNEQLAAPARIPRDIKMLPAKDTPPSSGFGAAGMDSLSGSGGTASNVFNGQARPKVKIEPPKIVNVSAGVAVGLLVQRNPPVYPAIAKTARVTGTVVLQAIISKTGTIEDLHAVSGPEMLRQAALDAVRTWRYKPYMLNNEPIAVGTTVNVVFSLGAGR